MLTCDAARPNISRFLDNELDARTAGTLAEHLNRCVACRHEYDCLRAVRAALRALPLPQSHGERAAVQERVFARLEKAARLPARTSLAARVGRAALFTGARRNAIPARRHPGLARGSAAAATFAAAAALAGAAYLAPSLFAPANVALPVTQQVVLPVVPLPGRSEMSLLYHLHDAHGERGSSGDDPIARRDTTAEAHAALIESTQAALAENL